MQSSAHESSDNDDLAREVSRPSGYEATVTFRSRPPPQPFIKQQSLLLDDLNRMRSALATLQNDRNQIHSEYLQSISRWKRREARMKQIIDKQRRALVRLKGVLGSGVESFDVESRSESSLSYEPPSMCSAEFQKAPAPLEHAFLPPWDVDMDDIRRQLRDIDDSINRVEQAKSTLNDNKSAVKDPPSTSAPRRPSSNLR
jgi:hypothetical protein